MLAERRGGRPVLQARSFVVVRRQAELLRLRIRRGRCRRETCEWAPTASHRSIFRRPREVDRRLSAIHRERTVRVWLNGRPIIRSLDRSQLTR